MKCLHVRAGLLAVSLWDPRSRCEIPWGRATRASVRNCRAHSSSRLIGRSDETRTGRRAIPRTTRYLFDNGCTQRRTRVTGVLLPLRPKLVVDNHLGRGRRLFGQESSIVDDEEEASASASTPLNRINFQRTWRIPTPPTGLCFFGRGLVSSWRSEVGLGCRCSKVRTRSSLVALKRTSPLCVAPIFDLVQGGAFCGQLNFQSKNETGA
jgi:hypothetical protein